MDTAVIKLYPLPDTISSRTKDNYFWLPRIERLSLRQRNLSVNLVGRSFVGRVKIRRVSLKFSGTSIHHLIDREDAILLTPTTHRPLWQSQKIPYPPVSHAIFFGYTQKLRRQHNSFPVFSGHIVFYFVFKEHHLPDVVKKPRIHAAKLTDFLD
ncbi:MAG: hypothetical protein DDT19_01974 [Syntrophomonadaceae bacterium]|nr:hypothetical protein [Bacillota bacterium]